MDEQALPRAAPFCTPVFCSIQLKKDSTGCLTLLTAVEIKRPSAPTSAGEPFFLFLGVYDRGNPLHQHAHAGRPSIQQGLSLEYEVLSHSRLARSAVALVTELNGASWRLLGQDDGHGTSSQIYSLQSSLGEHLGTGKTALRRFKRLLNSGQVAEETKRASTFLYGCAFL